MTEQQTAFSKAERAAILVMIMDDEQAAEVLRHLEPQELRLLGQAMCDLKDVAPSQVAATIGGFLDRTQRQGLIAHDNSGRVRNLMNMALGERKADSVMSRIAPTAKTSSIELAKWLDASVITPMVKNEHPQLIAVLLTNLEPETAAQVLHGLPRALQPQVVHRIATLGPVTAGALSMLETVLSQRITDSHGPAALNIGGPREAAEIINSASRATEKRIMPELAKIDRLVAKQIEGEMFKFDHLLSIDDRSMGALLREVDSEQLIVALKGLEDDDREAFFRCMSSRAADGVRDEIEARGRIKLSEVVEAQKAIVQIARRLAAEGTISFGAGDDDYV
jgi:flagellar motor switch protein FliG